MNLNDPNQHRLVMAREFPDGRQEWICPTCGRRIILQWPPDYHRIVVEPGDESVSHSGAMSAPRQHGPAERTDTGLFPPESLDLPDGPEEEFDPYLEPWIRWLNARAA